MIGFPATPPRTDRKLSEAQHDVWNADLLLFRRRGLISVAGRGEYTHGAMAGWCGRVLMCNEVREWFGGRAVSLESQLRGGISIDVFRPQISDQDRERALDVMRRKCGKRYAYHHVLAASLLHLPFIRLFVQPDTGADAIVESKWPEFCSEACANAYHVASGVDPVPHLKDRLTEPNDLARTTFFRYQLTLVP